MESTYATEAARKALFSLVDADHRSVITREDAGETQRALLVPIKLLTDEERENMPPDPAYGLTEARKHLGEFVAKAHGGARLVLKRHSRPVAILLPDDSTQPPPAPRTLGRIADGLNSRPSPARASYGLPTVDEATGGLLPGRLALVAAAPGVGGSLLAVSAARDTAVVHGRPVLYAASGPSIADVSSRVSAAHTGLDYQQLRAGTLEASGDVRAALDAAKQAPLFIDDGDDLTTDAIAATVPDIAGLALLVVDRLQTAPDPSVPLSGKALPDATRALLRLAREHQLPVLAAVDTDEPAVLAQLRADVVLHLERDAETARLTVTDADFSAEPDGETTLRPDFQRARFLDIAQPPAGTSERSSGPASPPVPETVSPATTPPDSTAKKTSDRTSAPAPRRGRSSTVDSRSKERAEGILATVQKVVEEAGGDMDKAANVLSKRAIRDGMALFEETRAQARYEYTAFPALPDIFHKPSKKDPDQIWEARPKWRNPGFAERGDGEPVTVTSLDVNAAYLSAMKTWLPVGKLLHSTSDAWEKGRSGVYLITPPEWRHDHLPNPLGDRQEPGKLWVTDPTLRLLLRCASNFKLCDAPVIHESWTSGATENILEDLRCALRDARDEAIRSGNEVAEGYIKLMYSKFVSTIGESKDNRPIKRPDWMHILHSQAYINLFGKAYKAHMNGLEVVAVRGTDELHVSGDWRKVFDEGRLGLGEMKVKRGQTKLSGEYTLHRRDA